MGTSPCTRGLQGGARGAFDPGVACSSGESSQPSFCATCTPLLLSELEILLDQVAAAAQEAAAGAEGSRGGRGQLLSQHLPAQAVPHRASRRLGGCGSGAGWAPGTKTAAASSSGPLESAWHSPAGPRRPAGCSRPTGTQGRGAGRPLQVRRASSADCLKSEVTCGCLIRVMTSMQFLLLQFLWHGLATTHRPKRSLQVLSLGRRRRHHPPPLPTRPRSPPPLALPPPLAPPPPPPAPSSAAPPPAAWQRGSAAPPQPPPRLRHCRRRHAPWRRRLCGRGSRCGGWSLPPSP